MRGKTPVTPEAVNNGMQELDQVVFLSEQMPIHIPYWTAWVDKEGDYILGTTSIGGINCF